MMNHNAAGEEVEPDHEDILECYKSFCMRVWGNGGVRVCEDRRLMEKAERMVFTQGEESHTFTLLPFYTTVNYLITNISSSTSTSHISSSTSTSNISSSITSTSVLLLQRLSKAFEILELLCINLFLFPWKKEFKILKKFTAPFVYYIKAVLPPHAVLRVLHHIGYDSETHTEYRLSLSAEPDRAQAMGLELFLAQLLCEHLVQRMSQNSEGLQIIPSLGSSETLQEEPEIHPAPNRVLEEGETEEEDRTHTHNFLFPSEASLMPPDQEKSECKSLKHRAILSEDKSILEMQKNYPDLAFRQRPIFKNSTTKMKRGVKLGRETSSHLEAVSELQSSEEQQLCVEASSHTPGFTRTCNALVTDLTEMMNKLELEKFPVDEHMKCPVEETNHTSPVLCCSPSHCSIFSTTSDSLQQHHNITKPLYIPNPGSCSATAPPAVHPENFLPSNSSGAKPDLHNVLEIL